MARQNRSPLGRGLDALINMDDLKTNGTSSINEIELSKIEANPDQPRSVFDEQGLEELATSIKALGVVQPITLREIDPNRYQIISGERRYRASLRAGIKTIPAYIKKASDENMMEMALIENIQREDLNSIEIALAFQNLIETYHLTQDQLSERIGKKRATIANFLRLLKLPAEIQMGIKNKKIDMGHAKALLAINDAAKQLQVYEQICENGFSVRETEKRVKSANENNPAGTRPKTHNNSEEFGLLQEHLSKFFNTKVLFSYNEKNKGKITIPFSSEKELERIIQLFDSLKK